MKKKIQKKNSLTIKGFSMVEFIVIISIFAIMTSVSMFNYNDHRDSIEQSNLAQNIALTIRQAQVYGISASDKKIGGDDFDAAEFFGEDGGIDDIVRDKSIRGASFNLDTNTITLFEDNINRDAMYNDDGSYADRVIDTRKILSKNISFEYVCLSNDSGNHCDKQKEGVVDVAFQRPYPDAIIHYREKQSPSAGALYTYAALVISSKTGAIDNKYVEIYSIGNITVKSNHEE